ncbi:MAG: adenylate kinase [Dehalococcoidia bacterium]|nr:adenylate kinase [Dehalococcoidia bacterium]
MTKNIIVFLGAPGAGKGTQATLVAGELSLEHMSTGELFRQAVQRGDELGQKVKAFIESGALVPDEITVRMVLDRLTGIPQGGIILDGFPRNLAQAECLDGALGGVGTLKGVVYIRVDRFELVRRLGGRWLCLACQSPHTRDSAQGGPAVCMKCGNELYQREDDKPATVEKRLEVYFEQTQPLIEYYRKKGKLIEVDGEGDPRVVTGRIVAAMGGFS